MDPNLTYCCAAHAMPFASAPLRDLLRRVLAPPEMIVTGHKHLTPSEHAMQGLQ